MSRPGEPIVGRAREAEDLAAVLTDPTRPRTVLVEGPPGVGVSALVEDVLARPGVAPEPVVRLVASAWETDVPYALLEQVGLTADPGEHPVAVGRRLLDAPALAERGRLVLLVDHAHDADPASLRALHAALVRAADHTTLLLLAHRPPPLELPDAHRIPLDGLEVDEVRELLRRAGHHVGPRVARAVRDLTAGRPVDVLDLAREAPPGDWDTRRPAFGATRRHRAAVQRARARVPDRTWSLLEALAVLVDGSANTEYPLDEVAALAGVGADAVAAAPSDLLLARQHHDGPRLSFTHPMDAAAVRDACGPHRVREVHEAAARRSGRRGDVGDELRHLVAAAPRPRADLAARLVTHAREQAARGAWASCARALVDAGRMSADPRDRAEHLVGAVDALAGAGRLADAEDLVADVTGLPRTARIDATLGYLAILRGRPDEADALLRRAWARCDDAPPDLAALVCARLVLHSLARCVGTDVVTWADRAIERGGHLPIALEARAIRGLGLASTGEWAAADAHYADLSAIVPATAQEQRVSMGRGWYELLADEPLSARARLESAVPTEVTLGSVRISLWAQAWLARTLLVLGEWDESLEVADRAAAAVGSTGHELLRPLVHWPAAQILALRGDVEGAERRLHAGAAHGHAYPIMRLPAALAQAQVAEARADHSGVLRALDAVMDLLRDPARDPLFWPWIDVYGDALVHLGRVDEADDLVRPHLLAARARGHRSGVAPAEATLGRVHGARGDIDAASAAFDRAERELASLPLPLHLARLRFAASQTLRRAGRRREADEVMRSAREVYAGLGAVSVVTRCDRELKASGLERTRTLAGGDLTPQEAAVVELVARGDTNREAAEELYVSVKTVQYHLTRVYAKLGVRSRSELAARYGPRSEP
ncbi:helix-turn-helix transcriptional regulator [Agilicoccus flavus]|uniref:helix-turn-helix transcriptional regulator n=1 Tax=Agilicoccus flavus TaxID=2775968 RepID=UPI001CF66155|nr:LuxR family transcriptional regulator [Agilicoccus flavus]